jgi:hypothetical protein
MIYFVQSNWSYPLKEEAWQTINSQRAGNCEFNDIESAMRTFEFTVNLSRVVCHVRLVDSDGKVYKTYDPDLDMRLPGSRYRAIQNNAYSLWEKSGKPAGEGKEFWYQAEKEIDEKDWGVR